MEQRSEKAVQAVIRAVVDEGSHPEHHRAVLARHRQQWPALWRALDELVTAEQRTVAR